MQLFALFEHITPSNEKSICDNRSRGLVSRDYYQSDLLEMPDAADLSKLIVINGLTESIFQ